MTQLLSLFIPRPERAEKLDLMIRAGVMIVIVKAVRAKSSAKAYTPIPGSFANSNRSGS